MFFFSQRVALMLRNDGVWAPHRKVIHRAQKCTVNLLLRALAETHYVKAKRVIDRLSEAFDDSNGKIQIRRCFSKVCTIVCVRVLLLLFFFSSFF